MKEISRVSEGKVLVLGSNSFSGATFVDHLLERGHEVIGCSRSPEPNRVFLPYKWSATKRSFQFHQCDLNRDLEELTAIMRREKAPYVVNFAAQSMVAESWANPDHWFMTNVVSSIRLHERLRHCDFLEKYVHVTTPEVYGSTDGVVDESAPFNPSTPYAVSRAAADMSLRTYFATYGFPVVFTRAANVFGPGQQLYRIVPRTILSIRTGRKLQLHGGGLSRRSFIHARDVAEATLRVMHHAPAGETYHISTSRIISVRDLVALICRRMDVDFASMTESTDERRGKDAAYVLNSAKLRAELGWEDRVSLEEGIDETVAWVDQNLDELKSEPLEYVHKP